jgi:hypothetical protein
MSVCTIFLINMLCTCSIYKDSLHYISFCMNIIKRQNKK